MVNDTRSRVELFTYLGAADPVRECCHDILEIGPAHSHDSIQMDSQDHNEANAKDTYCELTPGSFAMEIAQSFERGREQGIEEGREAEKNQLTAILQASEKNRVEQIASLSSEFLAEQHRLLQATEREVVKLSLAIANRILRREAQTDPLFLIGSVRVALGQLADSVQVRLRIPAPEADLWAQTMAHMPNLKTKPTFVADVNMQPEDCLIETEMGSVDLGLRAQLLETERLIFENGVDKASTLETNSGEKGTDI
jgi:flagellar biosynthesis/type III secretory pathway protein FliH